ncbi:MAG: hypothetical protein AAFZ99_11855 [Pseudomonadota bacterium]
MILRSIALALTSAATAAQANVDEARVAQLVAIICENGGSMETSEAAHILPAQGYTMEETQGIVAILEDRGQVVPTAGIATLKLTDAACQ